MSDGTGGGKRDGQETTQRDAVGRVERVIDYQISKVERIDDKAHNILKYVLLLLSLLATLVALPLRANYSLPSPTVPEQGLVLLGVFSLLVAVFLGISTYASTRMYVGIGASTARTLARGNMEREKYDRTLLNTYAEAIDRNYSVVDANAKIFKQTLIAVFVGLIFLSDAALLYAVIENPTVELVGAFLAVVFALLVVFGSDIVFSKLSHGETRDG